MVEYFRPAGPNISEIFDPAVPNSTRTEYFVTVIYLGASEAPLGVRFERNTVRSAKFQTFSYIYTHSHYPILTI